MHRFYYKMLEAVWAKLSNYYKEYEKAEQLMKMHALDRNKLVQDSYRNSFEIKLELQGKIEEKERIYQELEKKNRELKGEYEQCGFYEIDEMEKKVNEIKLEFRTGKKVLKDSVLEVEHEKAKEIVEREEEVTRSSCVLVLIKDWIKQQEKMF